MLHKSFSGQDIKVDVVVCGRFHYHKYIQYLYTQKLLGKFIYSYKINYKLNISAKHIYNYPLKEYFMYLGKYCLTRKFFHRYLSHLHKIWQFQVVSNPCNSDILHILIHGNSKKIINHYKKNNIKVIGEVVNVHPIMQARILNNEYENYGLIYNVYEETFHDKLIEELFLCDYLLAPSSFIKKSLIQNGINEEKVLVLPYGINKQKWKKTSSYISNDKIIKLLCVSQLTFRKGIIYLLKAMDLMRNAGICCELTLVGQIDPLYKPVIVSYLNYPNITYIKHIPNDSIYNFMREFDLFVMPSLEDGFGVVVSEALSVNLPVIVTENCGASEIVINGENGFIVKAGNEMEIESAIKMSICYEFSFNQEVMDWKDYSIKLEEIYKQIIKA